jgi:hypothetical protein
LPEGPLDRGNGLRRAQPDGRTAMHSWKVGSAFALVFVGLTVGAATCLTGTGQEDVNWLRDYEGARAVARQTGEPLFVAFR